MRVVNTLPFFFERYKTFLIFSFLLLAALYYQIILDMVVQWSEDPNYSHGFLVPLVSAYFIFERREELRNAVIKPSNAGLVIILLALGLLVVGIAGTEYFTMRCSLVFLLIGLVLYWLGYDALRVLALPLGFLFFMVPLPYIVYDAIAFPLKLFVAKYSVLSLKAMGVVVWREGNIIMFPQTVLEVADACSGLRSLMSLIALSVALAFFSQKTSWKRLILIVSAIPIAIFTNAIRVIVTGILAQHWGAKAAEGFFHEFAGMAVFVLAMILLMLTSGVLRKVGK